MFFFPWTSKKTKQKKQCIPHTWDLSTSGWWSLSALFEPCSIRLAIPWGSWQLGFMKSRSHPWAVFSAQRSTLNFTPNGTKYFFWGLSVTCPSHILTVLLFRVVTVCYSYLPPSMHFWDRVRKTESACCNLAIVNMSIRWKACGTCVRWVSWSFVWN